MSTSSALSSVLPVPFAAPSELGRIAPEPQNNLGLSFGNILKSTASTLLEGGASALGISSDSATLLNMQIEAQREMQNVSMLSNVEKSKHETQMAAIRNIRVG